MIFGITFQGRRSAIRIVERVCRDIKAPEATEAIELIVWGVKHSMTKQLSTLDRAIITATNLWKNPTAIAQFLKMVPVTEADAVTFLRRIGRAALEVAREEGIAEKTKNVPAARQAARELDQKND